MIQLFIHSVENRMAGPCELTTVLSIWHIVGYKGILCTAVIIAALHASTVHKICGCQYLCGVTVADDSKRMNADMTICLLENVGMRPHLTCVLTLLASKPTLLMVARTNARAWLCRGDHSLTRSHYTTHTHTHTHGPLPTLLGWQACIRHTSAVKA